MNPRHSAACSLQSDNHQFSQASFVRVKILVLFFLVFAQAASGGGINERIVARMNDWAVTLSSAGGSQAYISKSIGKEQFDALINFPYFWDYYIIFRRLPRVAKGKRSDFKIIEDDGQGNETVAFIQPEYARPIIELMLLNFRDQLQSFEPDKIQKELNSKPPIAKKLMPNDNFKFIVKPR